MAISNSLAAVIPTIFAQGLGALRSNCVMPSLVRNNFGDEVAEKGQIISIPLPSAIAATNVVPGPYAPDSGNIAPTAAQVPLNNWMEAPFTLTEKEVGYIVDGVVPIQITSAIQALAAAINGSIFSLYTGVYGFVGTPGTTPFANDFTAATNARKVLAQQLAPTNDRRIVLDPNAEANAIALPAFYAQYVTGDTRTIREGEIGRKLGFDWWMDQQVPVQTVGTLTGAVTASGAQAAGVNTVVVATANGGAFSPNVGDILTFANDPQTYAVTSNPALGAGATGPLGISPAKVVALAGGEAIALKPSHTVNLAFQRDAFAFASRPIKREEDLGARDTVAEMMMSDPVSGLSMRFEARQEFHRTRLAFDVLWGVSLVRPQLATRIAG